jgi:hypothetical protein
MAAGIWRPDAGAVEVVSKGRHNFQAVGFWAHPPAAAATAAAAQQEEEEEDDEDDEDDSDAAAAPTPTAAAADPPKKPSSARHLYLHIEDAVAMLDAGDLMLFAEEEEEESLVEQQEEEQGGGPAAVAGSSKARRRRRRGPRSSSHRARPRLRLLSLQEAVRLSTGPVCRVSGARLVLRAHLGRLGYVVGRFPARWFLRAGVAPGAPWRGRAGGGWAACDGRAGEEAEEEEREGAAAGGLEPKRRRREQETNAAAAVSASASRQWWPAVGDAQHPWLAGGVGGGGGGGGGGGNPPPFDLPTALRVPNWRYEAWLHATALAHGQPPPQLPLPARDASPLPHLGASLRARFPLLRPLPALADEELGLPPPRGAASSSSPSSPSPSLSFSPLPPPILPVLYDVHAASASFSARRPPGRPAFRVGLAPEGEAASGWALPALRDVAASERASAEAAAAAQAQQAASAARPVPVRWAAVLAGGDVAFFSVETARLMDTLGTGA